MALVHALEPERTNPSGDVRFVSVWQGDDPTECERVKGALETAGIEFLDQDSEKFDSFAPFRSKLQIWVLTTDREAAKKIVLEEQGRIDPRELTPEELDSLALPESDDVDDNEESYPTPDLPEHWYEDDPVVEVWSGDAETFADTLVACLREVGIASRRLSEGGRCRLVVRPEQEARAKEIVREVEDASPPK